MANHWKLFQLHLGQRKRDYLQSTIAFPSAAGQKYTGLYYCDIHWVISVAFPSAWALFVRRALGLPSKFGWPFTDETHNFWAALIFQYIEVLDHILEGRHNFWNLHVCKNLWITSNFIEPKHSWHSRHTPSHSRHSSRKITRCCPGKATWKTAILSSCLSSDFSLLLGSFLFLPSLLNPFRFFFEPLVFMVSLRLSLLFSTFLGPWLKFFKHYTNIFIVI